MADSSSYYQPCYYCANLVETIISPSAILASSDIFDEWQQTGHRDPTVPGCIRLSSHNGSANMSFSLEYREGLYYCASDKYMVDRAPVYVQCRRAAISPSVTPFVRRSPPKFAPTTCARQVESEVWALRLGSPGEHQLDVLPKHVLGLPPVLEYHPFRNINFKEWAYIRHHQRALLLNAPRRKAQLSSWTLASCGHWPTTIDDPIKTRIRL